MLDNAGTVFFSTIRQKPCWCSIETPDGHAKFVPNLAHFNPVVHVYSPLKCQEIFGFLTFLGGIEMEHWVEMG